MRYTPSEVHANEVHAYEVHTCEVHTYEIHILEVHAWNTEVKFDQLETRFGLGMSFPFFNLFFSPTPVIASRHQAYT